MRRAFVLALRPFVTGAMGPRKAFRRKHLKLAPLRVIFAGVCVVALVLTVSVSEIAAQSTTRLKGVVYDQDDGSPVEYARVSLINTAYETWTDESGRFRFENLPLDWYRVRVTAFNYDSSVSAEIRVTSDVAASVVIPLSKRVYELPGIVVKGKPLAVPADRVTVIGRQEIEMANPSTVADLLTGVVGVDVQRADASGGKARVSIRGSASRQVLVLIDGQRINSSADGEADLSSIPPQAIDRIVIHRGGASSEFGPDALGGVINIITVPETRDPQRTFDLQHQEGKWGWRTNGLAISNPIPLDSVTTRFSYSRSTADGDFPYNYTVMPSNRVYEGTRTNNDFTTESYHLSGLSQPWRRTTVSFSGQWYVAERGLPGRASDQNDRARSEDRRLLMNGEIERRFSERVLGEVRIGYSRFRQEFVDPGDSAGRGRFNSEYRNSIYTSRATGRIEPWFGQTIVLGAQLQAEELDHLDKVNAARTMGLTDRTGTGLFVSSTQHFGLPEWGLFESLDFDAALRYDHVSTANDSSESDDIATDYWAPKIGASLSVGDEVSLVLRGSYGKSLRLPSLNALFWKEDARSEGNPELKPEKSEHSEVGFEFGVTKDWVDIAVGVTYFHTFYYDLVKWRNFLGVWKPFNLAGARITGHEDLLSLAFWDKRIKLVYGNTVMTALNRQPGQNSYGKYLTLTPHYQTSLSITVNHPWFLISYGVRRVDRRYAKEANTKFYDSYRLDDLRLVVRQTIGRWRFQTEYKVYNARGENYTLITHYPMPPRQWQAGMSVTYRIP